MPQYIHPHHPKPPSTFSTSSHHHTHIQYSHPTTLPISNPPQNPHHEPLTPFPTFPSPPSPISPPLTPPFRFPLPAHPPNQPPTQLHPILHHPHSPPHPTPPTHLSPSPLTARVINPLLTLSTTVLPLSTNPRVPSVQHRVWFISSEVVGTKGFDKIRNSRGVLLNE